ncbi:MAG: XcyI family restriction endonuclease [Firmicutes bacterium]|nr:XcyI family restriction endonuclease [Bacillota bacterium]
MRFETPIPDTQISFYQRLEALKESMLQEALFETVKKVEINKIDDQLKQYVTNGDLQLLAEHGIRGEVMFAVPYVLEQNPYLIGYYRLLLGFSQKAFYTSGRGLGFGIFKSMEFKGTLSPTQKSVLSEGCKALNTSAALLLRSLKRPSISSSLIRDLTLLTLGPQLRGGHNVSLGTAATRLVFEMIRDIVSSAIISSSDAQISLKNAAGRETLIEFSSDPDIVIREKLKSGNFRNWIAIEIKGGTDVSNAHNRLGEAEKSHQKAKQKGFTECWTLLGAKVDLEIACNESPTTDRFFLLNKLAVKDSSDYLDFRENVIALTGIND